MKRLMSLSLILLMVISCIGSSSCADTVESTLQSPTTVVSSNENTGIETRENAVYYFQNDTIYNGKPTNSFEFRLDEDFQYAKIWVSNTSGGPITLSAEYSGGEFGDSYEIRSGYTKTIFVIGHGNTGKFWANLTAKEGVTLDGKISIKVGTKTGVGYTGDD